MKMLRKLMMSVKGAVVAAVPFALAYSTLGTATGTCVALTPVQLGALMAKLSAAGGDGNCTMANLTIAEVLSL